jgi:hypothetical protein
MASHTDEWAIFFARPLGVDPTRAGKRSLITTRKREWAGASAVCFAFSGINRPAQIVPLDLTIGEATMIWLAVALAALLVLCAAGVTAAAFLPDMPPPYRSGRTIAPHSHPTSPDLSAGTGGREAARFVFGHHRLQW